MLTRLLTPPTGYGQAADEYLTQGESEEDKALKPVIRGILDGIDRDSIPVQAQVDIIR